VAKEKWVIEVKVVTRITKHEMILDFIGGSSFNFGGRISLA
jgi:hypothetical protein